MYLHDNKNIGKCLHTSLTACCAASLLVKVINAYPLLQPAIGSIINLKSQIFPHFSNNGINSSSYISFGIFPQNTFHKNRKTVNGKIKSTINENIFVNYYIKSKKNICTVAGQITTFYNLPHNQFLVLDLPNLEEVLHIFFALLLHPMDTQFVQESSKTLPFASVPFT